jgi:hypothetical protein
MLNVTVFTGMKLKQKMPVDQSGMAFGWFRPGTAAKKHWGLYPASLVSGFSG